MVITCFARWQVFAAEFTAKVIDGLGRPLADAAFELEVLHTGSDGKVDRRERLQLSSDQEGSVKGSYDEKSSSPDKLRVFVSKEGYTRYSTDLRTEYVLKRKFYPKDIGHVAKLRGDVQINELKEVLAGEFGRESKGESNSLEESVFFHERQFRLPLRSLVQDEKVGVHAAELLAFIGVPEDLRLVIRHAPSARRELFKDRWAYGVVCALLEPATEEEWAFLKKCAFNEFDDRWVDAGAIDALKLIATPRSREMLQEVRKKNTYREKMIAGAVEYIESRPAPLADANLVEAGKKVAQAIKIGDWEENKEPRYNEEGDMALIDCEFIAGRDQLIHTATFHKVGDVWKLRGVRETMQALLAPPPERKAFIGAWHGFDESRLRFGRLELKEDGTGLLAISYLPQNPPRIYRVKQWSQRRFRLEVAVEPAEPEAEPISLQNVVHLGESLELEVHGEGRGWSRKMTLFNESKFLNRAKAAKESLEELNK